jgi:hypothetical protein
MKTVMGLTLSLVLIAASFAITIHSVMAGPHTVNVRTSSQLVNALFSASDGTTVFVNSGTYEIEGQSLGITKAITLTGEDANNTIIRIHPALVPTGGFHLSNGGIKPDYAYEPAIKIQGSDVQISGLTLSSGEGSIIATGSRIQIKNCTIATYLFANGRYQNVSRNNITGGIGCYGSYNNIEENSIIGYGIVVAGNWNRIHGNNITDCNTETAGYGIRLDTGGNTVFNNILENSNHAVGIFGMSSSNNVYANTVVNNVGGLELFGQGSNNIFHDNYVANNGYGVLLSRTYLKSTGENNTVYHNNFVNNTEQINNDQTYYGNYGSEAAIYPAGDYDDGKEGNYWSDYRGEDKNENGLGDSPYVVSTGIKDRYPLMQPWGAPSVYIFNLENATGQGSVSLNFTISKPTSWIGYSLDGLDNITVTGNTTLSSLGSGVHNITLYAEDMFENMGTSGTITFAVADEPASVSTVTVAIISTAVAVVLIGISLTGYFIKRRKQKARNTIERD